MINFLYLLMALVAISFLRDYWVQQQKVDQVAYSEFRTLLDAGRVGEVAVGDTYIRGTISNPAAGEKSEFITDNCATIGCPPIELSARRINKGERSWVDTTSRSAGS